MAKSKTMSWSPVHIQVMVSWTHVSVSSFVENVIDGNIGGEGGDWGLGGVSVVGEDVDVEDGGPAEMCGNV